MALFGSLAQVVVLGTLTINYWYLLSYYLANKWCLHVRSQDLEIPTLIGENKKIKITHHCHYDKNRPKIPLCLTKYSPPRHYKEINPTYVIMIKIDLKYPYV